MNKLIARSTLILLLFISGICHGQKASWNTVTDYDHNCSIYFPTVGTQVFKNTKEGLRFTTYSMYGQSSYFLKVTELISSPVQGQEKAKKVIKAWATKVKGKITEENDWEVLGRLGKKAKIEISEAGKPEMLVFCQVILVGKIQYEVIAMTPKEIYDKAFEGVFLDSFNFLK